MQPPTARKASFEDHHDELFILLFPVTLQLPHSVPELLLEHYNPAKHARELARRCYQCHIHQITKAYEEFRLARHSSLQDPPVSNFYENKHFVDMEYLRAWMMDPSLKYPSKQAPSSHKQFSSVLDCIYLEYGCIPNLERFLLSFPSYLQKQCLLERSLYEGGKIDHKQAYFLGYCGAVELGSVYMMARMLKKFIKAGGTMDWIQKGPPDKFKDLLVLNRKMARSMWEVSCEMIEGITRSPRWSNNQLSFCLLVLAFSHQQSTIALAMGLIPDTPEQDLQICNMRLILDIKREFEAKVANAQRYPESVLQSPSEEEQKQRRKEASYREKKREKKKRELVSVEMFMTVIGRELEKQKIYAQINTLSGPLLPKHSLVERRQEQSYPIVDFSDYNFTFMAYPILHSLTQDAADKLLDLSVFADGMVTEKLLSKQIRKALRYYSQNLCGYMHQEEDYRNNVNEKLSIETKFYVRLVTLSPIHITREVLEEVGEVGHVAILIANTKMTLELTFAMQAFEL